MRGAGFRSAIVGLGLVACAGVDQRGDPQPGAPPVRPLTLGGPVGPAGRSAAQLGGATHSRQQRLPVKKDLVPPEELAAGATIPLSGDVAPGPAPDPSAPSSTAAPESPDTTSPPQTAAVHCAPDSCGDGGCVELSSGYGCVCPGGLWGTKCELATVAISVNGPYACALLSDDSVRCWGENSSGQAVAPAGTFAAIDAGGAHACGIHIDGSVECWGDDSAHQAQAPAGKYSAVACGRYHSCALADDGTLRCWGDNRYGQLDAPEGTFTALSAGTAHTCALDTQGEVRCWGDDRAGQSTPWVGPFMSIAAGADSTCAIRPDHSAACWGTNVNLPINLSGYERISLGSQYGPILLVDDPVQGEMVVASIGSGVTGPWRAPIRGVEANNTSFYLLYADGRLEIYELGGFAKQQALPIFGGAVAAVACGDTDDCAIDATGNVACWGGTFAFTTPPNYGPYSALAVGDAEIFALGQGDGWGWDRSYVTSNVAGAVEISAGALHACAVQNDGTPTCWGRYFELEIATPFVPVHGLVSAWEHDCALDADDMPICWGRDDRGESSPPTHPFSALGVGAYHSCGITPSGTLECWGDDSSGQASPAPGTFKALAGGYSHTCGIRQDGSITCWGDDGVGQLRAPPGVFDSIAAAGDHSCAVRRDHSLHCWGSKFL